MEVLGSNIPISRLLEERSPRMSTTQSTVRIGIFGSEPVFAGQLNHHPGLWNAGIAGSLTHAGGVPVDLCAPQGKRNWGEILEEIDGVVYAGFPNSDQRPVAQEEALCLHCREHKVPLLAIDNGLLLMNTAFGGTVYQDLSRELPEALQHRHPPEEDIRHAINIVPNTHLANTYGEGEVVVNSMHRSAVQRLARGFRVCGLALDNVIEAIEHEAPEWFAMGVQWQPASITASGLDIQVFRTLVDVAAKRYVFKESKPARRARRALANAA
jgi:putative glutamine amidotransferase